MGSYATGARTPVTGDAGCLGPHLIDKPRTNDDDVTCSDCLLTRSERYITQWRCDTRLT